jgi:hypothetical protein
LRTAEQRSKAKEAAVAVVLRNAAGNRQCVRRESRRTAWRRRPTTPRVRYLA